MRIAALRLHIDGAIAVKRVHDRRQDERGRIGAREAAVTVGRPLHRRAHAVAIAKMDVVAHADLIAVVNHRGAGHREQADCSSIRCGGDRVPAAGQVGAGCRD